MRFLRRVLRASASAGVSSTLRSSTPFLPLRTLPSASAFSVRRADSRAAISPAVGLTAAVAAPALADVPCGPAGLPPTFAGFGSGCGAGFTASFGAAFGAFCPASFDFSRVPAIALPLPFGAGRLAPFDCGRFRVRRALFEASLPPRFRVAGFLRGERVALVDRRAGAFPTCVALAVGRALRFARAEDFLAGLRFVAMVVLIGAPGARAVYPVLPRWGRLGKTANYNMRLRAVSSATSCQTCPHQSALTRALGFLGRQIDGRRPRQHPVIRGARSLLAHRPVMFDPFEQLGFQRFAAQTLTFGRRQCCDEHGFVRASSEVLHDARRRQRSAAFG